MTIMNRNCEITNYLYIYLYLFIFYNYIYKEKIKWNISFESTLV